MFDLSRKILNIIKFVCFNNFKMFTTHYILFVSNTFCGIIILILYGGVRMNVLRFLGHIDSDPSLAGTIAILIMVAVIVVCAAWLIVTKLILKKKYMADEEFVKEYKAKLKEREESKQAGESEKSEMIKEDF